MSRVTIEAAGESTFIDYTIGSRALDLVSYRVFPTHTTSTYGDYPAVLGLLGDLGIKAINHILDPTPTAAILKFIDDAYAMGIRSNCTIGSPRVFTTDAEWVSLKALLKGRLRGKVGRVGSWNEPNHLRSGSGDPPLTNWAPNQVIEQGKLWAAIQEVNADYDLTGTPHIKVLSCQLWSGDIPQQYSDLKLIAPGIKGKYDLIGWHLYMRPNNGVVDWTMLDSQESQFRTILGDFTSGIDCSESGFFTAPNYTGGSNPVTQAQQATLLTQLIQQYVSRGWYLNLFELLNDPYDTTAPPSSAVREYSFGTVCTPQTASSSWWKKPGFAAVKNALI